MMKELKFEEGNESSPPVLLLTLHGMPQPTCRLQSGCCMSGSWLSTLVGISWLDQEGGRNEPHGEIWCQLQAGSLAGASLRTLPPRYGRRSHGGSGHSKQDRLRSVNMLGTQTCCFQTPAFISCFFGVGLEVVLLFPLSNHHSYLLPALCLGSSEPCWVCLTKLKTLIRANLCQAFSFQQSPCSAVLIPRRSPGN